MITSTETLVSPEYAIELLAKNVANRPYNKATVDFYASQMVKGLWRLNGEPIIISDQNTLLNGQHRLKACTIAGVPFPTIITTGIPAEYFTTMDTGRTRTTGDIFSIEGIAQPYVKAAIITKYFNFKKGTVRSIDSTSLTRVQVSKTQIRDFYDEHAELVEAVTKLAQSCYGKFRLLTLSMVGAYALFLTIDKGYEFEEVSNFFLELFHIQAVTNPSIEILYDALMKNFSRQRILSPTMKTAYIIKTWNAYAKGKVIKQLKFTQNEQIDFE